MEGVAAPMRPDEVERGAGVGGDFERADAGSRCLRGEGDADGATGSGTMVAQLVVKVKSDEDCRPLTWIAAVPVFESSTVWGREMLPAWVAAKVSELCEAV